MEGGEGYAKKKKKKKVVVGGTERTNGGTNQKDGIEQRKTSLVGSRRISGSRFLSVGMRVSLGRAL